MITPLTRPFWHGAKKHELLLQRCKKCNTYQWYPKALCIDCGSRDLVWTRVSGLGTVYSYIIIYHTRQNPSFQGDVPYNIAIIELDEGPYMYSNVVGCSLEQLKIGMRVRVVFDEITEEITLPKFRPITSQG